MSSKWFVSIVAFFCTSLVLCLAAFAVGLMTVDQAAITPFTATSGFAGGAWGRWP